MPDLIEQVAPDLLRLSFGPVRDGINIYLIGDVLVDSGPSWQGERLLRALRGRPVTAHAITHAHFDHQGASHFIAEALGIPVWCGEGDRAGLRRDRQRRVAILRRCSRAARFQGTEYNLARAPGLRHARFHT